MDHFSRLRRNKKAASATPGQSHKGEKPGNIVSPTGSPQPNAPSQARQKSSHFRGFHLRSSHKRARDSPPASRPRSPTSSGPSRDAAVAAPSPSHASTAGKAAEKGTASEPANPPKMPGFLQLREQEVEFKFQELLWLERNRVLQSLRNQSPDFRWARVIGPHLKTLDRYMNIQPWQNNRIKLQVPPGKIDYINASPIVLKPTVPRTSDGTCGDASMQPDKYIAMQGPKQVSTNHVWRMVVEQTESPAVIVMLTETYESNIEKCFPYFPRRKEDPPLQINTEDEFGDGFLATVRCEDIEETPAGDAIELRKLVVKVLSPGNKATVETTDSPPMADGPSMPDGPSMQDGSPMPDGVGHTPSPPDIPDGDVTMKSPGTEETPEPSQRRNAVEGEERTIWHLLFKEWPDFGVPNLESLDSFFTLMRLSREKNTNPNNPRIVHCSAGVGRSGTFIALEHLIRELDAGAFENYDETAPPAPPKPDSDAEDDNDDDNSPGKGEECNDAIFNTVNQLRKQRRTMVQAEAQYLFIYQVMRKLWQDKYGISNETELGEPAPKRLEIDPVMAQAKAGPSH